MSSSLNAEIDRKMKAIFVLLTTSLKWNQAINDCNAVSTRDWKTLRKGNPRVRERERERNVDKFINTNKFHNSQFEICIFICHLTVPFQPLLWFHRFNTKERINGTKINQNDLWFTLWATFSKTNTLKMFNGDIFFLPFYSVLRSLDVPLLRIYNSFCRLLSRYS